MKVVKGDLIKLAIEGQFDAIVHGCNCFKTMGAGIALQIANTFPAALEKDKEYSRAIDKYNKLGTISYAEIAQFNDPNELTKQTGRFQVINAYTQYHPGRTVDYDAIRMCLRKINHYYNGCKIGLPQIGCGIAGGDWN